MRLVCLVVMVIAASATVQPASAQSTSAHGHAHRHDHAAPGELPTPYPDRIALTWSGDPATTLSITWRTDPSVTEAVAQMAVAQAEPSFYTRARSVEAVTEVVDLSPIESEYVKSHYHSASFTNLRPGTLYAYRVGDGTHWSEWFHARTAKGGIEPISFLYFGDAQNNVRSHWSRAIRAAYAEAPDAAFMIHAGDLVSDAHSNIQWGEWHQAGGFIHSMLPGVPVPGNHEYDAFTEAEDSLDIEHLSAHWRAGFTLPTNGPKGFEETAYFLDVQGVRIIGLNSEPATEDHEALAVQTAWLDSVLSHNPARWTIPTFHHPIFSSGQGRDNPALRAAWKPLFDEHRVDIVLQGHDHTYARGRAENVVDGVNVRSPQGGTVYVNSVSGAKMYQISPGRWENYYGSVEMERSAENTQLFQVIRIEGDTLRFRAFTVTGDLYDAFELVKRPEGAPNEFIARVPDDASERTHRNTIPYARQDDEGQGTLEGMVERVGTGYAVVGGSRYVVTGETVFEGGNAASLSEGHFIEVEFVVEEDGTLVATAIELDDNDRDLRATSGALTDVESVNDRSFIVVGGTRVEIVPGETTFVGADGITDLVVDRTVTDIRYILNEAGDAYKAVRVEVVDDLGESSFQP